jgi:hypothetical protein
MARSEYMSRNDVRYTIYDNKTDFPIIVEGTSRECTKVMGLSSVNLFYQTVAKCRKGVNNRWTVLTHKLHDDDLWDEDDYSDLYWED